MEQEQWKPIEGTNSKYEVSNFGRVRTNGQRPGLLTLTKQPSGYRYAMIELSNGKKRNCRVHRLVAQYFIPNTDNLREVNHKDGNKDNNRADNLEWCTRSHNVKHSFDTGLKKPHRWTPEERKQISERNKGQVITSEQREKISQALKGRKHPEVSARQKGKPLSRKAIDASIATRKRKAEERRAIEATKPKRPRGRLRKHPID